MKTKCTFLKCNQVCQETILPFLIGYTLRLEVHYKSSPLKLSKLLSHKWFIILKGLSWWKVEMKGKKKSVLKTSNFLFFVLSLFKDVEVLAHCKLTLFLVFIFSTSAAVVPIVLNFVATVREFTRGNLSESLSPTLQGFLYSS